MQRRHHIGRRHAKLPPELSAVNDFPGYGKWRAEHPSRKLHISPTNRLTNQGTADIPGFSPPGKLSILINRRFNLKLLTDICPKTHFLSKFSQHLHIAPTFMTETEIAAGNNNFSSKTVHKDILHKILRFDSGDFLRERKFNQNINAHLFCPFHSFLPGKNQIQRFLCQQ